MQNTGCTCRCDLGSSRRPAKDLREGLSILYAFISDVPPSFCILYILQISDISCVIYVLERGIPPF